MKIPSIGIQVFPFGRIDMTKLTVAFRNFVKAPNKYYQPNMCYIVLI